MKKTIYFSLTAIIFLLSFRCYSALFYPLLNSDHAVNILMMHSFHLPDNFYFWGQDRVGSLIPLLGQPLFKVLHLSAVTTESVVHYLILLAGFLALSTFIRSTFLKIILAIIWFFPPMRFIDVIELYSGIEYSLIAIACYLISQLSKEKLKNNILLKHLILILITLLLIASVWVSDMAIISIALLLMVHVFYFIRSNGFSVVKFIRAELFYLVVGALAAYVFFSYAKGHAPNKMDYTIFSDFKTVGNAFRILLKTVLDLLVLNGGELFTSFYSWILLIFFIVLGFSLKNVTLDAGMKKWIVFFVLDALVVFGFIILSRWTFLNGVPRRYFTCTYISVSMLVLLLLDNAGDKVKHIQFFQGILLTAVLIGGIGTIYNMKYFWPRTLTPKIEIASEFKRLGEIGVIAEYWNAYIVACPDPEKIKATPHDREYVRNPEMVEAVFRQKNIYIIRDMWLPFFPDSLKQFDRMLLKDGNAFRIGDCEVCKYRKAE